MKFYPSMNLYKHYTSNLPESIYFSKRIPDQTVKNSLDNLNRAMNICEHTDTFLDFGAGNGRYSSALLPEFKRGYATEVDHATPISEIAQKNHNYTIYYGKKAIAKIKEKLDLVIFMDVIEHIPIAEIDDLIKKVRSLQKAGGVIYISTPNALKCGPVEKSGIFYKRFTFGHHKHYVARELVTLFAKHGYTLMIEAYEDFPLRLFVKTFNIGFSYQDQRFIKSGLYRFITWPLVYLINGFFSLLSPIVNWDELRRRHDDFESQTMLLTFKKIKH